MLKKSLLVLLLCLVGLTALVSAQDITPRPDAEVDPNANISWPPPVYVLRGEVEIRGSANLANMTSYLLEFRPVLFPDAADPGAPAVTEEASVGQQGEEDEEGRWFPATLPTSTAIIDGVLGIWNTETAPDGIYELRLKINISGGEPVHFVVGPLRVENELPEGVQGTATAPAPDRPTLQPSPTQPDSTPTATVNRSSVNIRGGDSIDYPVIATALEGETFRIVGISSRGTGWYYVEGDFGRAWISPTVVDVSGDLGGVPRVDPPPPPFTPTPTPTNTPEAAGDLIADAFAPSPNPPVCNETFSVMVNVRNIGNAATNNAVDVIIRDVHVASGEVQTSALTIPVPRLAVGESFVVGADLTVSTFFNEEHRIEVIVDPNNVAAESNEGNNTRTFNYTLAQGGC